MFRPKSRYKPELLLGIKRDLYTLRKAIYPLREVFNTFLRRDQVISARKPIRTSRTPTTTFSACWTSSTSSGTWRPARWKRSRASSNRLNETVKRLTVIAICVAIMGAVFGAWGMNFSEVPLHDLGLRGFAESSVGGPSPWSASC